MPTTSPAGLPVPTLGDAPNVPADMLALATALDKTTIPRFASSATRDAAFPAPLQGQQVTVAGVPQEYVGSSWLNRKISTSANTISGVYFYSRVYGVTAAAGGITAITWPAFPNGISDIQLTPSWRGAVPGWPMTLLHANITKTGCGIVMLDYQYNLITTGAHEFSAHITGY